MKCVLLSHYDILVLWAWAELDLKSYLQTQIHVKGLNLVPEKDLNGL